VITVQKEALTVAARQAHALAAKKSPIMIHSHAALRLRAGVLEVGAFNGQGIWGSVSVPAEGDIDRDFCVDAALLVSALGSATGSEVTLDAIVAAVQLKSGRAKWRLATLPADDFVDLPAIEAEPIVLSGAKLASLFETALFAMGQDASRAYLSGLEVAMERTRGPRIEVRSTDGHRAVMSGERFDLPEQTWKAFLPAEGAHALAKWLGGRGEVALRIGVRQLSVHDHAGPAATIAVQLGEDALPDFSKLIPSKGNGVRLATSDLVSAAKSVVAAAAANGMIELRFTTGELTVVASGNSEATIEIPCDWAHDPITLGVKAGYLIDGVSHARSDDVTLRINGPLDPILVSDDEGGYRSVVMPMRIGADAPMKKAS
jgi:DNA polymerase III sliding clamp (beta) subunit (PCNA family)